MNEASATLLFDTSLGKKGKLAKHVERLIGIRTYLRRDVARAFNRSTSWRIRDSYFIRFAKAKGCVLVTGDWQQYRRAIEDGVEAIFVWDRLPFWTRVSRILFKLNHPLYRLSRFVDLRLIWGVSHSDGWGTPTAPKAANKERQLKDQTYLWR